MRKDFYAEYFRVEDRHWWFLGRRRIILELLSTRLAQTPHRAPRRILDLGCGTGTMLGHLRRFGDAQGVDVDEDAVRFCHARGEATVRLVESETALPFADDAFDVVTALDVLEHIADDRGALREVARILRPGGLLLATVPAHGWMWGPQDEISHHFRRYSGRRLRGVVQDAGLEPLRSTYFNTLLFPPIAAIRLARRLRPVGDEARSDFEMTREGAVNTALARLFASEARLLRRRSLPFGVSLLVVAREPASGGDARDA